MNTDLIRHFDVFTHAPEAIESSQNALVARGNRASVVLTDTLPTNAQCLQYSSSSPQTTWVFIAPRHHEKQYKLHYDIAWYQAQQSIQRCGHGTLAAAFYLHQTLTSTLPLVFHSASEQLHVSGDNNQYCLQFKPLTLIDTPVGYFTKASRAAKTHNHDGYCIIDMGSDVAVKKFELNQKAIDEIQQRALIVTSVADNPQYDLIFRYFAPQYGITEDQATGSAGPCLWAFWQDYLVKQTLSCYQASRQGGMFTLSQNTETVNVSGYITEK